jgi:hypothetical protein
LRDPLARQTSTGNGRGQGRTHRTGETAVTKPPGSVRFDFSHEADTCDTLGRMLAKQNVAVIGGQDTTPQPPPKPTIWQRIRRAFTGRPIDTEE